MDINILTENNVKLKIENEKLKGEIQELENKLKKYTSNNWHKKYYEDHKEGVRTQATKYLQTLKETNPEKLKEYRKRAYQKRKDKLAIIQ